MSAAQEAAFAPFNAQLARSAKDRKAGLIADQIKTRSVKLKE